MYDSLASHTPAGAPLPLILAPETLVRLENPLTPAADRLRSTLLGSMLNALAANLRAVGRVALFEIGKVYWPLPGELLPAEPEHVAIALAGPREAGAWLNRNDTLLDFFDLKGLIEELLERLGLLGDARFEPATHPLFGPKAARVLLKGRPIGVLGELRQRGVTVMIATHDLNLAAERFDRVMLLNRRLVGLGRPAEVFAPDKLLAAYGGAIRLLETDTGVVALSDTCCDGH